MAGKNLTLIPFNPEDIDIHTYLQVVKPVLDLIFPGEEQDGAKISTTVMKLGKYMACVSEHVQNNPQLTWAQFSEYTETAISPSLGSVLASKLFHDVRYTGDLEVTLSTLNRHALHAFPQADTTVRQNHVFNALLQILPSAVAEHFAVNEPRGYLIDIPLIRRILAVRQKTKDPQPIAPIARTPTQPQKEEPPSPRRAPPTPDRLNPSRQPWEMTAEWARVRPKEWRSCGPKCQLTSLQNIFQELCRRRNYPPQSMEKIPWIRPPRHVREMREEGGPYDYPPVPHPNQCYALPAPEPEEPEPLYYQEDF
jgi:hypothetical protein